MILFASSFCPVGVSILIVDCVDFIIEVNFETEMTEKEQKHKIENALNDYDYVLTNDTLEQLEQDVRELLRKEVVLNEKND